MNSQPTASTNLANCEWVILTVDLAVEPPQPMLCRLELSLSHWAPLKLQICELNNWYCFQPPHFGVVCYIAIPENDIYWWTYCNIAITDTYTLLRLLKTKCKEKILKIAKEVIFKGQPVHWQLASQQQKPATMERHPERAERKKHQREFYSQKADKHKTYRYETEIKTFH